MKQPGIGTVVGTTTSDVMKKLKETGPDSERRRRTAVGRDRVSISSAARELIEKDAETAELEDAAAAEPES
jgi:glutamyl-tRNA reductase